MICPFCDYEDEIFAFMDAATEKHQGAWYSGKAPTFTCPHCGEDWGGTNNNE